MICQLIVNLLIIVQNKKKMHGTGVTINGLLVCAFKIQNLKKKSSHLYPNIRPTSVVPSCVKFCRCFYISPFEIHGLHFS